MSSTHIPKKPIAVVDDDQDELIPETTGQSSRPPYSYSSLPRGDSFRLLELLPGHERDSLTCNLTSFSLDAFNIPPYRALSYTWGASQYDRLFVAGNRVPFGSDLHLRYDIRHPLYVGERRILISTNLRDALRCIRHRYVPIKLWIDAVCINQLDDAERAAQIMLMPRIYHHASTVLLWLGNEDDETAAALSLMKKLADRQLALDAGVMQDLTNPYDEGHSGPDDTSDNPNPEQVENTGTVQDDNIPDQSTQHDHNDDHGSDRDNDHEDGEESRSESSSSSDSSGFDDLLSSPNAPVDSKDFAALVRLFQRPVFRRIWCVQEAAVAGSIKVMCGPTTPEKPAISYYTIATAVRALIIRSWAPALEQKYFGGRDLLRFPTIVWATYCDRVMRRLQRATLVYDLRGFEATDPRDKVFAMLGLLNDYAHRGLRDLAGIDREAECANGHAHDCPHFQEQTREWAETKWERGGGLEALWYAANTRIYALVADLVEFFQAAETLLEFISVVTPQDKVEDVVDKADEKVGVQTMRADADAKFLKIRKYLDDMTHEYVSSDELVSYRWASNATDDCLGRYDEVYDLYEAGGYVVSDTKIVGSALMQVSRYCRMMKREEEYASSEPAWRSPKRSSHGSRRSSNIDNEPLKSSDQQLEKDQLDARSKSGSDISRKSSRKSPHSHHSLPSQREGTGDEPEETTEVQQIVSEQDIPDIIHLERLDEHQHAKDDADDENQDEAACEEHEGEEEGHSHEWPAENSLAAYASANGGIRSIIGLEYMAPRQVPERPTVTSEPIKPWSAMLSILPDYSLSAAEVFRNFTAQTILTDRNLDILSAVEGFADRHRIPSLPSWVPDYSVNITERISPIIKPAAYISNDWRATNGAAAEVEWDPASPDLLRLKGIQADTITAVSVLRDDSRGFRPLHKQWRDLATYIDDMYPFDAPPKFGKDQRAHNEIEYLTIWKKDESMPDSAPVPHPSSILSWRHLIRDLTQWFHPMKTRPDGLSKLTWGCYLAFLAMLRVQQFGLRMSDEIEERLEEVAVLPGAAIMSHKLGWLAAMRSVVIGRRLAVTKGGHLIWGPERMEVGDEVFLLKGGQAPYVLRKRPNIDQSAEEERYEFLGECFSYMLILGDLAAQMGEDAWRDVVLD